MSNKTTLTRRQFLFRAMIAGGTGIAALEGLRLWQTTQSAASDRLRVGIIGLGSRGRNHLDQFLKLPNVEIAAVCDIDHAALSRTKRILASGRAGSPFYSTKYRNILDRNDLDAISVAMARPDGMKIAAEACQSGKHVLLERPAALYLEDGNRLAEAADKNKVMAQLIETQAFAPANEVAGMAPGGGFGSIEAVNIQKQVEMPPQNMPRAVASFTNEALMEHLFDELDVARCVLDVETPTVCTAAVFDIARLSSSLMLHFEFDGGVECRRKLDFELRLNRSGGGFSNANTSRSTFSGTSGSFVLQSSSPEFGPCTSWANFVDSIRAGDPTYLQNPAAEMQKSMRLVDVAAQAIARQSI